MFSKQCINKLKFLHSSLLLVWHLPIKFFCSIFVCLFVLLQWLCKGATAFSKSNSLSNFHQEKNIQTLPTTVFVFRASWVWPSRGSRNHALLGIEMLCLLKVAFSACGSRSPWFSYACTNGCKRVLLASRGGEEQELPLGHDSERNGARYRYAMNGGQLRFSWCRGH